MNKIAILGATGHIAKGIVFNFIKNNRASELVLFARSIEKVKTFLTQIKCFENIDVLTYEVFSKGAYSVIINCIGFGNPNKLITVGAEIFEVTEKYDNLIIEYLKKAPDTLYINISSGAVYGNFVRPAEDNTVLNLIPNHISINQYYCLNKLYSEIKHRANNNLNIVDLRIFGYFSRFIDINAGFLLSDIAKCIKNKTLLITKRSNIIRDYIHPVDLFNFILLCIEKETINCSFDVCSCKPVTKYDLLMYLKIEFGLSYEFSDSENDQSLTENKVNYYSQNRYAGAFGFEPKYSSIETITAEMKESLL